MIPGWASYKPSRPLRAGVRNAIAAITVRLRARSLTTNDDRFVKPSRDAALALITMGVELLEQDGVSRQALERLLQRLLDAPAGRPDPRADTFGT